MFGMRRVEILLIGGVLAALPLVVAAQTATVPADKLVQRYTALAGTEENAAALVTGLRAGTDITLSGDPAGPITITNQTGMMGYGNVNITLALAEKQLSAISNPSPTQLNDALTNTENGILTLRAQGMGWGEIAQALGFKLGDVMRASAAGGTPGAASTEKAAASQRISRADNSPRSSNSFDRPQKAERPEKPAKPERPERSGR
jgi:hypothetical protein